jgi:hypothetical protein
MGFFEIGSFELFAQAGFELPSSSSLPPQQLGLQAWVTGAWLLLFLSHQVQAAHFTDEDATVKLSGPPGPITFIDSLVLHCVQPEAK